MYDRGGLSPSRAHTHMAAVGGVVGGPAGRQRRLLFAERPTNRGRQKDCSAQMHEIVNASRSHLPFSSYSTASSVSCSRHVVLQFAKSLHCQLAELRRAVRSVSRDQVSLRAAKKRFL